MNLTPDDIEAIAAAVVARLREAPAAPTATALRLSKAELATALHRTPATIDRWVVLGMPHDDMGTYRLFDLEVCRRWVAARPRTVREPPKARPAAFPPPGVELRTRRSA